MPIRTLPFLLGLALVVGACVSVRTVDVAPTPDAVAGFVADALEAPPPERVATLAPDSLRAAWLATDDARQRSPSVVYLRRALDDVESASTYLVGDHLVDVWTYPDASTAKLAVPGLQGLFGLSPLLARVPADGAYYTLGPLVVRVLRPLNTPDLAYRLDDGLGRPREVQSPAFRTLYERGDTAMRRDQAWVREIGREMQERANAQVELVPPSSAAK